MSQVSVQEVSDLYRVEQWSSGYFKVNEAGHLALLEPETGLEVDLLEVIEEAKGEGLSVPIVVRFHDVLRHRVQTLNETFAKVMKESEYEGEYYGVYPVKVNQMREVVEEIVDASRPFNYGLEAGSKAELLTCLAYGTNHKSLTILNGFKDDEYLELAMMGQKMGRQILIVVESLGELEKILDLYQENDLIPRIGLRVKLSTPGNGKWAASSGERSKFGLTLGDIMNALLLLKEKGRIDSLQLVHFHLGSQVGDISTFTDAIKEVSRVYVELYRLGANNLQFLDVGGGLAVDYDGSKSDKVSSCNYGLEEYVNAVVASVQMVCKEVGVSAPHIVTESGRYVTAHHSCLITEVLDVISPTLRLRHHQPTILTDSVQHEQMQEIVDNISGENLQASFHQLKDARENVLTLFKAGVVGLEELTQIDELFWFGMEKLRRLISRKDDLPDELNEVESLCRRQVLCNFSVFQSAADSWAIGQLLPILPLQRLQEWPETPCSIADITCDSDGKIDHFIEMDRPVADLPLHEVSNEESYYLGIFMTGAYQDVMGDNHNLFGRLNEVHVYVDKSSEGNFFIEEAIAGSSKSRVLSTMQYHDSVLADKVMAQLQNQVSEGKLIHREAKKLMRQYNSSLTSYTYLESKSCPK